MNVLQNHLKIASKKPNPRRWSNINATQARRQRGGRGAMPPRFSFLPPDFFLAPPPPPPAVFFWGKEVGVFGGKYVKICDFGQKKPSHFGENLCPPDFNFAPPPRSRKAGNAPDATTTLNRGNSQLVYESQNIESFRPTKDFDKYFRTYRMEQSILRRELAKNNSEQCKKVRENVDYFWALFIL